MPTQLIIHERLDDVAGVCSSLTDVGLVLLFHRDQKKHSNEGEYQLPQLMRTRYWGFRK